MLTSFLRPDEEDTTERPELHLLKWTCLRHLQVHFRRALLPSHALLLIGQSRSLQPFLQVPLVVLSNANTKRLWPRTVRHISASKTDVGFHCKRTEKSFGRQDKFSEAGAQLHDANSPQMRAR